MKRPRTKRTSHTVLTVKKPSQKSVEETEALAQALYENQTASDDVHWLEVSTDVQWWFRERAEKILKRAAEIKARRK